MADSQQVLDSLHLLVLRRSQPILGALKLISRKFAVAMSGTGQRPQP